MTGQAFFVLTALADGPRGGYGIVREVAELSHGRLTQDGRRALAEQAELRAATAGVVRARLALSGAEAAG